MKRYFFTLSLIATVAAATDAPSYEVEGTATESIDAPSLREAIEILDTCTRFEYSAERIVTSVSTAKSAEHKLDIAL